jgi:acylphosphatase
VIRRRVIVHGRVQGVFFRAECASVASAHGVSGWVSNQPDGTVFAEFEGPEDAVDAVVDWCHTGSARSTVTRVDVTALEPTGETGFSVH